MCFLLWEWRKTQPLIIHSSLRMGKEPSVTDSVGDVGSWCAKKKEEKGGEDYCDRSTAQCF